MIGGVDSSWTSTGADAATMATGVSALSAATVWIGRQLQDWRARRRARQARNWDAYLDMTGVYDWFVQVVDQPTSADATVVVRVLRPDGSADTQMAEAMRRVVQRDGRLAAVPTPEQFQFLLDQRAWGRRRRGKPWRLSHLT
jgi:hypothetical protein